MSCLAHTEAVIDFGDDDRELDINESALSALIPRVRILQQELEMHLKDGRRGEIVREGVQIALAGPPNAGIIFFIVGAVFSFCIVLLHCSASFAFHFIFQYISITGKSSLMNALARRPAAIVSPIAGTTRCNKLVDLLNI